MSKYLLVAYSCIVLTAFGCSTLWKPKASDVQKLCSAATAARTACDTKDVKQGPIDKLCETAENLERLCVLSKVATENANTAGGSN